MSAVIRVIVLSVLVALAATSLSASGWAQGFFQNLFGIGNSSPSPSYRSLPPPAGYGYRAPIIPPTRSRDHDDDEQNGGPSFSGHYKTVCVRMCDGYYFPVSASVSRRAFYRDANICRSSCGNEARLFVQAASSSDASTLIDLTGRAYSKLPVAFKYRKTLVDGCKCKPEPWSHSELERHRRYALDAPKSPAAEDKNATSAEETDKANPQDKSDVGAAKEPERAPSTSGDRQTTARSPSDGKSDQRGKSSSSRTAQRQSLEPRKSRPLPVTVVRPQPPPKPFALGLGGGGLRWPGD